MRILVADDNKANLLIAQTTLERRGHHVELAHNGFDAIDLVRTGKVKEIPVSTRPLSAASDTLDDLKAGKITGRVVLTTD